LADAGEIRPSTCRRPKKSRKRRARSDLIAFRQQTVLAHDSERSFRVFISLPGERVVFQRRFPQRFEALWTNKMHFSV